MLHEINYLSQGKVVVILKTQNVYRQWLLTQSQENHNITWSLEDNFDDGICYTMEMHEFLN